MIHELTPPSLQARLAGGARPRVVDVRETDELTGELGHIAGVEHVPLATLPGACARWRPDEEVIVVCRSGGRSRKAATLLVERGFRDVHDLSGGMLAWNAARLPVTRGGAER